MKTSILLLAVLTGSTFASDEVIPVAFGKDRYEEMSKLSPFKVATTQVDPPPTPVNPFANIVLRGLGSDYVVIQRLGDERTIRISKDETVQGFHVKAVNWSNQAGSSTVVLTNDGQEGIVEFDKNLVRNSTPAANHGFAAQNGKQRPKGLLGGTSAIPHPLGFAGIPVSKIPHPLNPAVSLQPQPKQKPGYGNGPGYGKSPTSDATGGRTRIREIQNTQLQKH